MRLTDKSVQSLASPPSGVKVYSDDVVTGFGIRCSQGGSKAFVLTLPGASQRRVTIGKVGVIGLADARLVSKRMLAKETLGIRSSCRRNPTALCSPSRGSARVPAARVATTRP
jgi:hypothetical protein